MIYEIDQSGKVEDTARRTVIAISNGEKFTILLLAKDKRILQEKYRQIGKPRIFTLQVFAGLIYLLLVKTKPNAQIVIDLEYKGNESLIKSYLARICISNNFKINSSDVSFKSIGKRSAAHKLAIETFRRRRAGLKVELKKLIKILSSLEK